MEEKKENQKYSAPAVRKVLEMLELMAKSNRSYTLSEIVNELDVTSNSAFRIFKELEAKGYVIKDKEDASYELTPKIYYLGNSIRDRIAFVRSATSYMKNIRRYTKETVILTKLTEEFDTLVVDQMESREPIKFISTIGNNYESYCSAMGKVMLAFSDPADLEDYLNNHNFEKMTENTITSKELIRKELRKIKEEGVAYDREENLSGLTCIACPVFSAGGVLEGAIGISGLSFRMKEEFRKDYAEFIKEQAKALSYTLGYEK